ncbi:hypothetical protein RQP46_004338 [Phenoliferia psychrophenolica]
MPRSSTSSTKGRHITHPEFVLPKGDACCIKHWKHEGKDALDLAEAYFTGITASPSPLSFSLPPASASFTDSATEAVPLELASPGTFITPEFDFAEFLASTFPYNTPVDDFSSHSSSPPPPLLEPAFTLPTPPHSPEALNLFHFDEGSPIDALDALFGTARASGWEQGSGMEIPVDMGFLFPQHLGPVQDPYWISP